MFNTPRNSARWVLLAVLTATTQTAMALGLGSSSVESYLNQPLRAKIDLITGMDDDLEVITVKLASAEDFALIGARLEDIPVRLSFAVSVEDDKASILISSKQALNQPIVRLIVEVNWANGRLLREYTLFLDPPAYTAAAPSPVIDQRKEATAGATPAIAEPVQTKPAPVQEQSSTTTVQPATENSAGGGDEYGPVRGGDTLWRIASDWSRGTDLDLNAVMLSIQRSNPHAFINANINLLKRDAILRMPQVEDVRQLSIADARNEVRQQSQALAQDTTPSSVATPLLDENSQAPSVAVKSAGEESTDQLELVPPSDQEDIVSAYGSEEAVESAEASTAVEALRAELARKEEELIIEQQQNQYLQDRIGELENRLQSDQQGNVADSELSQLEDSLREERLATPSQTPQADVPQVTSSSAKQEDEAWYTGMTAWLIGLLMLAMASAGWYFSRRNAAGTASLDMARREEGTVRELKDEAEEILKVLKDENTEGVSAASGQAEKKADTGGAGKSKEKTGSLGHTEDAELLDEDSTDPEVRLDLARAYISMGDREAARVILDEVMENGTEEQQGEAKAMLAEL